MIYGIHSSNLILSHVIFIVVFIACSVVAIDFTAAIAAFVAQVHTAWEYVRGPFISSAV